MKKTCSLLIVGMLISQSTLSFADQVGTGSQALPVPQITPITGLGGGTTLINPGQELNMKQVTQSNTDIALELLKQQKINQDLDREYVKGIVQRLNAQLMTLSDLKMSFYKLSLQAQTGTKVGTSGTGLVQLEDYLNLLNQIANADQILRNDIQASTLITRETLPSYSAVEVGDLKVQASTSGNVNLTGVMTRFDALRVSMIDAMNNFQFSNMETKLHQSVSVTHNALTPDLSGIRILTAEEMQDKVDQINLKMTLGKQTRDLNNDYVDITVNLVNQFLQNYGTEEWLRWRNENDKTARAADYAQITDAFMRRSYLRKQYGVRLGALRTATYEKSLANIEDLTYQPMFQALKTMQRTAATNQLDVAQAFEDARNWVELYDKKLTPVFKSRGEIMKVDKSADGALTKVDINTGKLKEYASDNTGVLVRMNAAVNTITGQKTPAEALIMMMRLVLSDATEEMLLYTNSFEDVKNYHNAKYRATAEMKLANNAKICAIDSYLADVVVKQICGGKKAPAISMSGGRSTSEKFYLLLQQINVVELGKRQEAGFLQAQVDQAIRATQAIMTDEQNQDALSDFN